MSLEQEQKTDVQTFEELVYEEDTGSLLEMKKALDAAFYHLRELRCDLKARDGRIEELGREINGLAFECELTESSRNRWRECAAASNNHRIEQAARIAELERLNRESGKISDEQDDRIAQLEALNREILETKEYYRRQINELLHNKLNYDIEGYTASCDRVKQLEAELTQAKKEIAKWQNARHNWKRVADYSQGERCQLATRVRELERIQEYAQKLADNPNRVHNLFNLQKVLKGEEPIPENEPEPSKKPQGWQEYPFSSLREWQEAARLCPKKIIANVNGFSFPVDRYEFDLTHTDCFMYDRVIFKFSTGKNQYRFSLPKSAVNLVIDDDQPRIVAEITCRQPEGVEG